MTKTVQRIHVLARMGGLFLALALLAAALSAAERPNIVLVMADDHGWHEVSYYDHPYLKTPVLDEMARQGLRFDRFYAAAPVCSPTRASVMTGRHPNRSGVLSPNHAIRPEEITIAQILKKAGYQTGHFGKWHLGPGRAGAPNNPGAMGFDTWLSHDNFFGYSPLLVRDGAPPRRFHGESSWIVASEAIKYIEQASKNPDPFFTVVWFGSPHEPYSAIDDDLIPFVSFRTRDDIDKRLRHRLGEIVAMDRAIGQLRDFLRDSGLRDNTLLWYCSDNGTPREGCVWTKLRGSKGTVYEGGLRVPAIIEWPDRIKKPGITNVPAVTSDIMPTICDVLDLPLKPSSAAAASPASRASQASVSIRTHLLIWRRELRRTTLRGSIKRQLSERKSIPCSIHAITAS